MSWKNRIIESGMLDPAKIKDNPRNWRKHPDMQAKALAGALSEVGWVQEVIVNKRTGHLVDGHLRAALARQRGEKSIPVKYVDLSENEEGLILATLDPLAALAEADKDMLKGLLEEINTGDAALQELLARLAEDSALIEMSPPESFQEKDENVPTDYRCPKCGYQWSGKQK